MPSPLADLVIRRRGEDTFLTAMRSLLVPSGGAAALPL